MSQICKVLRWMCAFIISFASAQVVALLPWSSLVVGVAATIAYMIGQKDSSILMQVIAIGLVSGWAKCFIG